MEDSGVNEEKQIDEEFQISDQTCSLPRRKIAQVFITCSTIDFAGFFEHNTLSVALPIISASLKANSQASSITAAYFLTSTSFQLLYGRLSDIWSRKTILISSLILFFIGSLGSSFAPDITTLIAFRALTGIGGGGIFTMVLVVVGDVVSFRERGKWHWILSSVVALSHGISPIIGGKVASHSQNSWRWIFRMNLLTSGISMVMVFFFLPLKKVKGHWKSKIKTVDFFGAILTLSGSSLIILGLSWGGIMFPWLSPCVIITLTLGVVTMMVFILWEWKYAQLPLLPVTMFKSSMVNATSFTTFMCGWNYFVQIYFIPSFYQLAFGYTPVRASFMLLPIVLVQTASSTLGGLIVTWRGRYRESLILGYILWSIGLGLHSALSPSSSLALQLGYGFILGLGTGQIFQPSLIAMQAAVGKEHMAVITGVRSFIRELGGAFGLAITGSILNRMIRSSISQKTSDSFVALSSQQIDEILKDPISLGSVKDTFILENADIIRSMILSAYFDGFRRVFYLGTTFGVLTVVITIFFIPQIELDKEKMSKEEEIR